MGLAAPLLQVFAKGLGQAPAPVFGFCSSPLGDAGPARIFPPAHKPRLPQMRDGGMVRGTPSSVKGACPAHAGCGMVGARKPWCRRSSGVEHALGKGGVVSSILTGGTTQFRRIPPLAVRSDGLPNMQTNAERGGNLHRYLRRGCGRKSLFVHTEKRRRPGKDRRRGSNAIHAVTTRRMCTIVPGRLQGLFRGPWPAPVVGPVSGGRPENVPPTVVRSRLKRSIPGANFARKGFPSARMLEAELRDNLPIPYPNLLAA